MNIVALLESMWGWRGYSAEGDVIRYFRINPENHSGRRLYSLIGNGDSLLVTNSCRECQATANHHGIPDPAWVKSNLEFLAGQKMDLLLVCGKIARETYASCGFVFPQVIYMDHPAARRWTRQMMDDIRAQIAAVAANVTTSGGSQQCE